uniref:Sphingosine kinase 1 n=1 Tax=Aceria tosichella TaxID=561515 RepID=A0A6G1S9F4_9ACAR
MTIDEANAELSKGDSTPPKQTNLTPSKEQQHNFSTTTNAGLQELIAPNSKLTDQHHHHQPILVLVNPHSGRGNSIKIFKKHVLAILNKHGIKHEVFVTTTDLRVRQYLLAKRLDELTKYRSIMVIAGDGLLYETVNAIMARDDWQRAIKIPIGAIPTGSGNGLAYTLLNSSQISVTSQTEAVRLCCEQVIRADRTPCDLVKVRYGKETIWSFLSIGWGLLADIDIDSEWLRFLGEFRFTVYGVLRSLTSVSYRGRLSFKLLPDNLDDDEESLKAKERIRAESNSIRKSPLTTTTDHNEQLDTTSEWIHIEDKFVCLYAVHQTYVNSATNFSPKSSLTDQLTYLTYIRGSLNIYQVIEFLLSIENGSHEKLPYVRVVPVQSFEFEPLQSSKVVVDGELIPWTLGDGPISATVVPKALNLAWSLTHTDVKIANAQSLRQIHTNIHT